MRTITPPSVRFERFIERLPESGCWIWLGTLFGGGYGNFDKGYAHRFSYREYVGEIPEGLDLDHLCRVRCCVNPAHLEAVTRSENLRRGDTGIYAIRQAENRTHCQHGHPFDEKNTSWVKSRNGKNRRCKECLKLYMRRRRNADSLLR